MVFSFKEDSGDEFTIGGDGSVSNNSIFSSFTCLVDGTASSTQHSQVTLRLGSGLQIVKHLSELDVIIMIREVGLLACSTILCRLLAQCTHGGFGCHIASFDAMYNHGWDY